jgi:hypothetical protein
MPKWGDYLLGTIPEYKVFFDAREIQFDKIQYISRHMFNVPKIMNDILQTYHIQSVILASDFFLSPYNIGGPLNSRRAMFFPTTLWGVVSYDNNSFLLLKRIPEHEKLLAENEYHYLIPDSPLNSYFQSTTRNTESDKQLVREIKRCRQDHPSLQFCIDAEKLTH